MSLSVVNPKPYFKKNVNTQQGLFNPILITKRIPININNIGNNIKETLEKALAFQVEGKCIVEGYIKPNSIEIMTFSSGLVMGSIVMFEVVFQCYVCSPVEGTNIHCIAKHINKAGIRAEVNETPSPLVIFIARDHNYTTPLFSQIKENDEIKVRVIGQRFELNDKYISVIAELIETHQEPHGYKAAAAASMMSKPAVTKLKIKTTGQIAVPKKISLAQKISTELANEIAEEVVEESSLVKPITMTVIETKAPEGVAPGVVGAVPPESVGAMAPGGVGENPPEEPLSSDLYDQATVFRFYNKSADKPLPGKGQGEQLGPEGAAAYTDLARVPEWRRKLSNFWSAEFKLDGHKWLSVEHYYQGSKYKKNNRAFYLQFSLDSKDSSIAKNTELAKAAGGKTGMFKGERVRPKDIVIDPDFFQKKAGQKFTRGEIEMESAMREKFTQNADLKALLLATKKAKLEHISRGSPPEVFNDLMRVRRELQEASSTM